MTTQKSSTDDLQSLVILGQEDNQNSTSVPLIAIICFNAFLILFFFAGYALKINFDKQQELMKN